MLVNDKRDLEAVVVAHMSHACGCVTTTFGSFQNL